MKTQKAVFKKDYYQPNLENKVVNISGSSKKLQNEFID